ncbi:MAG: hypothetical protein ACK4J0_01805 [Candidatus Anstonellaceae archaeon]
MRFECHRCKKEIEDLSELNYKMDKNGFTYSYCKDCIKSIEQKQE